MGTFSHHINGCKRYGLFLLIEVFLDKDVAFLWIK
jgi:hypothetical protein